MAENADEDSSTSPNPPAATATGPVGEGAQKTAQGRIALCLSGGGFRATFFHLGVIRLLRDASLLEMVTDVFSVSGGSIIAGHLARRWSDYVNPPADQLDRLAVSDVLESDRKFHQAATELIRVGLADLRGRIARRWLLLGWLLPRFRRTRQLELHLSRLYGNIQLGMLPEDAPAFRFLSTSLTTGDCCFFSRNGYTILRRDGTRQSFPATHVALGRAVAASAAFPPVFPPLAFEPRELHAEGHDISYTERLADGGVFDNTGLWALEREVADKTIEPVTFVIVSDASMGFDWKVRPTYSGILRRNVRASDILMERVAGLQRVNNIGQTPVFWLSLHDLITASYAGALLPFQTQDPGDQAQLKFVRTDLDVFGSNVIRALVMHGYEVAWRWYDSHVRASSGDAMARGIAEALKTPWDPCPPGWPDYGRMQEQRERDRRHVLIQTIGGAVKGALRSNQDLEVVALRAGAVMGEEGASEALREAEARRAADLQREVKEAEAQLDEDTQGKAKARLLRQKELHDASSRRIGLWNWRDWASYALLLPMVLVPVAFLAVVVKIVSAASG
jgi:predicted acylesterase/phospholipase RssA